MIHRRYRVVIAVLSLAAALPVSRSSAWQVPAQTLRAPETIQWNLQRLHQEPFKLIKATPDARTGRVRFVIEFTRRPELAEAFDWEHRGGPVVFRFVDEDGVVLRTVKPALEGELVAEKGARIRLLLQLPDRQTLERTRSIAAE